MRTPKTKISHQTSAEGEIPIEKFCWTASKLKLNRRRRFWRLRVHQERKKAPIHKDSKRKRGFRLVQYLKE